MEMKSRGSSSELLKVYRYPSAEKDVYQWSGLAGTAIQENDIVIIGYVESVLDELIHNGFNLVQEISDGNGLFKFFILNNIGGRRILVLGFTDSYWGSIAGKIAEGLYGEGAELIIHIAKAASCRNSSDVGKSIFIPMFFAKIEGETITPVANPFNPILNFNPACNTGVHISVRSVLDETYAFREIVSNMRAASVDVECAEIVRAAQRYYEKSGKKVGFSGVYFASDYIQGPSDKQQGSLDLTSSKQMRKQATKPHTGILSQCISLCVPYLRNLTQHRRLDEN